MTHVSFLTPLKWLNRKSPVLPQRVRQGNRALGPRFVPRLEALEDRMLLSYTFTPIADTRQQHGILRRRPYGRGSGRLHGKRWGPDPHRGHGACQSL